MPQLSTADAVVRGLRHHGIQRLYALPGVQMDPLFDALCRDGGLPVVHPRHEQTTAYMAMGEAKVTGAPAAFCVVPGPGVLNTAAALSTAWATNAPVLCLAGQIARPMIGRGTGQLHELPDQTGILERLTKGVERVARPEDTPAALTRAFARLRGGRPRPVAVELPADVLAASAELAGDAVRMDPVAAPDPAAVVRAAAVLAGARRPLIWIGGGAMAAGGPVLALARRLGAAVAYNQSGKGALPDGDPCVVPGLLGHALWAEADVVLAIGTRLATPLLGWGTAGLRIVRIDIDPDEPGRIAPPEVALVGDAALCARALLDELGPGDRPGWSDFAARKSAVLDDARRRLGPQMQWLAAIRRALPEDSILVDEATQVAYCARFGFPVERPRSFVTYGYQGTLGYGFPTALGAQMAAPGRQVVALTGDGGFQFGLAELATAVQFRIPLITVLFVDGRYGNVHRMQEQAFGGRHIATTLTNPDFAMLAASYGCRHVRVAGPAALERAIRVHLGADVPLLIEVPVAAMPDPWPLLHRGRCR